MPPGPVLFLNWVPAIFAPMTPRYLSFWMLSALSLLILIVASLYFGSVNISFSDNGDLDDFEKLILWESRLPRTLVAIFAGSGLALAGLLMQTLFRNPLAGPSVLGISSGSSLAVAALTLLPVSLLDTQVSVVVASIIGSFTVLAIILSVARKFADITSVLIVGLMLSFFASAVIGLLQSIASENAIKSFVFWGFGSFSGVSTSQLLYFIVPVSLTILPCMFVIKPLNALLLGEMHAESMGVKMKSLRVQIMLATGLLTGIITAFCGPVAFIGLVAPHLARIAFQSIDHRIILPASLMFGATLSLLCDVIARLPGADQALPLNTVCAFMGAPVVVYLVLAGRKKKILL